MCKAAGLRLCTAAEARTPRSFELRGDGTMHEWIIHNAAPQGAAKIQSYPDAYFAASIDGETRVLQTHPHASNSNWNATAHAGVQSDGAEIAPPEAGHWEPSAPQQILLLLGGNATQSVAQLVLEFVKPPFDSGIL